MISITIGSVYSQIVSRSEQAANAVGQLEKYMKARPENYQRSTLYREHRWDGYKNYLTPKGRVLTGLVPDCVRYLKQNYPDIQLKVIGKDQNLVEWGTIPTTYTTDTNEVITLRDYALQGISNLINNKLENYPFCRGMINAAPNAGKTAIIVNTVRTMTKPSALILVHRKAIYKQLITAFRKNGIEVGEVSSKQQTTAPVVIGTIQTVYSAVFRGGKVNTNASAWLKKFQLVIVDESHTASSSTYQKVLKAMDAPARLFLSGSALSASDDCKKLDCIGLSGQILLTVSYDDTIQMGVSLKPLVNIHKITDPTIRGSYTDLLEKLYRSKVLITKVMDLLKENKYTLITVEHYAAGQAVYDALKDNFDVIYTHGQDPKVGEKIDRFKQGLHKILIATMIIKEGVNLPLIQSLIRLDFGKSKIKTEQVVGRSVRKNGSDTTVDVHDFMIQDEGETLMKHSLTRCKHYRDLGFDIAFDYAATPTGRIKKSAKI